MGKEPTLTMAVSYPKGKAMRNQDNYPGRKDQDEMTRNEVVVGTALGVLGVTLFTYFAMKDPGFTSFLKTLLLVLGICVLGYLFIITMTKIILGWGLSDENRTREHHKRLLVTFPTRDRDGFIIGYKHGIMTGEDETYLFLQVCDEGGNMEDDYAIIAKNDDICWKEIK